MDGHERLYCQYSQSLLELAEKIVHDPDVARDIVHDAWIVIITGIDKIENPEKAVSWMKGIVRNLSLKHLRYQGRHRTQPLNQEAKSKIDDLSEEPLIPYEELMTLINALPERYGSVFRLAVLQDKSHEEIGKLLGIAPHSSSSNLARAKKILRERIGKYLLLVLGLLFALVQVKDSVIVPLDPGESIGPGNSSGSDNSFAAASEHPVQQRDEVSCVSKVASMLEKAEVPDISRESKLMLPRLDPIQPVAVIGSAAGHNTIKPVLSISRYGLQTSRIQRQKDIRLSSIKDNWRILLGSIPVTATQSIVERAFTIVPDFIGGTKSIDNWADYQSFLFNNKAYLSLEQYENLHQFAFENSLRYFDIFEKQTDFKPVSLEISLEKELIGRWSLRSGLGVTFLKSLTESGDPTASFMSGTRKTWYLGIPLGVSYQLFQNDRLSFYSTAGGRLDIPVVAFHSMEFTFDNTREDSITLSGVKQVAPGLIWSIKVGTGLQYQIVPHLRLYLEPTLQYSFPNSSGLQTWYSTHPLTFEVPLGIRFNW